MRATVVSSYTRYIWLDPTALSRYGWTLMFAALYDLSRPVSATRSTRSCDLLTAICCASSRLMRLFKIADDRLFSCSIACNAWPFCACLYFEG